MLNERLEPLRRRRAEAAARPDDALDILRAGSLAANARAEAVLAEVMEKMGLQTGAVRAPIFHNSGY